MDVRNTIGQCLEQGIDSRFPVLREALGYKAGLLDRSDRGSHEETTERYSDRRTRNQQRFNDYNRRTQEGSEVSFRELLNLLE